MSNENVVAVETPTPVVKNENIHAILYATDGSLIGEFGYTPPEESFLGAGIGGYFDLPEGESFADNHKYAMSSYRIDGVNDTRRIVCILTDEEKEALEAAEEEKKIKDFNATKQLAISKIDLDAESFRLNFITTGSGQAMAYQEKLVEAEAYLAEGGDTMTEAEQALRFPHMVGEVGITASTAKSVAETITGMRNNWKYVSARIEKSRLTAKELVKQAKTEEEIQEAVDSVVWDDTLIADIVG